MAATLWVIVTSERTSSAWAWALAMVVCAPLATLLYYLLGEPHSHPPRLSSHLSYSRLQSVVANECGASLVLHNRVQPLHNGAATFASLMRDVQRARHEINLEYYILAYDGVGRALLGVLMRKARAGVKIRIIYDGVGSWSITRTQRQQLEASGIEVRVYSPIRFPYLTRKAFRRNHRKIVVIDNRIAYLGGINLAERYLHGNALGFWRDEHLRIEGAAVRDVWRLFASDWHRVGGCMVEEQVKPIGISTLCPMQILWAEEGASRMALLNTLIETIASAHHNIRISTPYFLPPDVLLKAIVVAARSGVRVEILIPSRSDIGVVALAAERYIARCVESGARVYRYGGGFLHAKTITIDDSVAIVGSANIDYRSLYYNMEVAALIYNRCVVADYISRFNADIALSQKVCDMSPHCHWTWQSLVQGLAHLIAPLL